MCDLTYRVVQAYSTDGSDACYGNLKENVNKLIDLGYKPYDSLQFVYSEEGLVCKVFQAMIKED